MMVDPCFPCLHDHSIWTGEPKAKYDAWRDENLSWEEIEQQDNELMETLMRLLSPNDPSSPATVGEPKGKQ